MPDFGPTNKALRQALNMMWQMGMMKQRDVLSTARQEKYFAGLEGLGVQRQEQSMVAIEERFQNQLARDPKGRQLRGVIFSKERRGEDTSQEREQLKGHIFSLARVAVEAAGATPQTAIDMANSLTESGYTSVLGQLGQKTRLERRITGIEKPKMAMEEKKLRLQREKFEREKLPLADYKAINTTKIAPLRRFLLKFVSPDTPQTEKERLMREVGLTEESKKVFGGDITPERVYKLLSKLDKIGTRFLNNQGTPADLDWISRAYNIISIQEEFEEPIIEEPLTHPGMERTGLEPAAELPTPELAAMSARQIYIDELIRLGASSELAEKLANRRYGR